MLYFYNPGEIDIRGATVAGLSAKDNDSPIGYFGTGLKYSIACILRWGGSITIYSGRTAYDFTSSPDSFRGQEFHQVLMNDQPLGFTTDYGKNWEPWQVYRELYANALDEGGGSSHHAVLPEPMKTVIVVDCEELKNAHGNRDSIILPQDIGYDEITGKCQIKNIPSEYIYYRGVRVAEYPTQLLYNFSDGLWLTEDRTVGSFLGLTYELGQALNGLKNREMLYKALSVSAGVETDIALPEAPSNLFTKIAVSLWKSNPQKYSRFYGIIPDDVRVPPAISISFYEQKKLDRAVSLCEQMGYPLGKITLEVADIGSGCHGKFYPALNKIHLHPSVVSGGMFELVSTLYEELFHAHTGLEDCTYKTQTHLFNTIIRLYSEYVLKEVI